MGLLDDIKKSVSERSYSISSHARKEMSPMKDDISEKELIEAILDGEVIEDYSNDKPCG